MLAVVFQTLSANWVETPALPPDLSNSSKSVDRNEAKIDDDLKYSITMRNNGGATAELVSLTDVLPAELEYVADSLQVQPDIGLYGESAGVITWTGALNVNQQIVLNFNATVSSEISPELTITNTAVISSAGVAIERSAQTTIVSSTTYYSIMPVIFRPPPDVNLTLLAGPSAANEWTIGFTPDELGGVTGYEIEEANDASFHGATLITIDNPALTSLTRAKTPSPFSNYYYRARAVAGEVKGFWSNVLLVAGNYVDDFSNTASGWHTVRQDTDDTEQSSYYLSGRYVHRQHGRWDYLISSPLIAAPGDNYRIEADARFIGVDNLHTLGFVFGGDWNGTECPNKRYTSCFNHYYRLLAIWYGSPDRLRVQLKRIDGHDGSNTGRGVTLVPYTDVKVKTPTEDWQKWTIEVREDGRIRIFVNNNLIASVTDTTYIGDRYFGGFSATNEYAGLEVRFRDFSATVLE
jgi:uncharacterized repeat protein (TIGR01451 family)